MFASDRKLPVEGGREKREYVRGMFDDIAPTYDRLNRIMSLRLDLRWRKSSLKHLAWERRPDGTYLDLCAGTMDYGALLVREPGFRGRVLAADFARNMLRHGRGKGARLFPAVADALELPYPDAVFDGAVVGWGVRNLVDLDAGFREAARVLRPGARLVVLEMSTPPLQPMRGAYLLYFERLLPVVGRMLSKHTTAYNWLPESARVFPEPPALAERMRAAGFDDVYFRRFMGGVTAMHVGTRR